MGNTKEALFTSPTNNLRIVKIKTTRRMSESGEWDERPGQTLTFSEGQFRCDKDSDEYRFLHEHPSNGSNDGASRSLFYEIGDEPPSLAETNELLRKVLDLALDGELEALADLLVAERSSESRPEVIAAIEKAIEKSGGELPPLPETPEHEITRVRREPAVGQAVPPVDSPGPAPVSAAGDVGYVGEPPAPETVVPDEQQAAADQTDAEVAEAAAAQRAAVDAGADPAEVYGGPVLPTAEPAEVPPAVEPPKG